MQSPVVKINVRALPNGRRAEVVGPYGDAWKVRVTAAPERGRANAELAHVLAEVLGIGRHDVEVVRGHGSRDKVVAIRGLDADEVGARLVAAAGG